MIDFIENIINTVGYAGIVIMMCLENIFPPIPSEIIMPAAGFATRQGKLTLPGVILAGTIGAEIGALVMYTIGNRVGEEKAKEWADRHGRWLGVSAKDIEKGNRWLDKYGLLAVFLGRLTPGLRALISLPAGIAGVNLPGFIIVSTLSAALWSSLLAYAGSYLGKNYETVSTYLDPISYLFIGGIIAFFVYRVWRGKGKE